MMATVMVVPLRFVAHPSVPTPVVSITPGRVKIELLELFDGGICEVLVISISLQLVTISWLQVCIGVIELALRVPFK